jgi:signal recognition particle subunit SRP54
MFEALGEKLDSVFRRLGSRGKLTEKNIEEALREIRLALLEADVHFRVVREFIGRVREKALGQEVLASLTPEQHLIKIVHAELAHLLGGSQTELDLQARPPVVIMLVGLNGAGKTTTAAKLARLLKSERHRSPYLVPADTYRPAAIEQLATVAREVDCPVHPVPADGSAPDPVTIARQALDEARRQMRDTIILDTAGRFQIEDDLMAELERMKAAARPHQILLVADAMTGQEAVNVASGFHERLGLSGIILTKMEGDARGGAALSMRSATGRNIVFVGVGERLDALEPFHPQRVASRILGMGDVLSLIEKAERVYDREQAAVLEKKLRKNQFTLEDFREQMRLVKRMGYLSDLVGLLPGGAKLVKAGDGDAAERELKRVEAIIDSMTRRERLPPEILNGSRRKRIARGSGTSVTEVNRFLKQYTQARKLMRKLTQGKSGALMKRGPGLLFGGR